MGQQDRVYVAKVVNALTGAMFAACKEADIPQEVLDGIVAGNQKAVMDFANYLRAADMSDKDRALRANMIAWANSSVLVTSLLDMELIKDERLQGEAPKITKPKGFG